jgi:hypothetical protein
VEELRAYPRDDLLVLPGVSRWVNDRAFGDPRVVRGTTALAALVLVLTTALSGCSALLDAAAIAVGPAPGSTSGGTGPGAASGDAAAALAGLPVKGRAPKTGYTREQFGPAWADVDRNGCDTRNDVLKRDLDGETFKPGTHDCIVLTGTLKDPYTGKTIAFKRGQDTSDDVQIDHLIALSNAWQTGAQQLSADARRSLGNDPLNLQAVDGPTNNAKGDGDAATWLPPQRGYWCSYVARQIAVKAKYKLWVTRGEHDRMAQILGDCPGQALPTDPTLPAPA